MFKKITLFLLMLLISANLFYAQDSNVSSVTELTDDTTETTPAQLFTQRELTPEQVIRNEIRDITNQIRAFERELSNTEKEITVTTDRLLFAGPRNPLPEEEMATVRAERSALLLRRVEIRQNIIEKRILMQSKENDLKNLQDDRITVEGTLNWNHQFDLAGKTGPWHIALTAIDNMRNTSFETAVNINIDPKSDIPTLTVINPLPNARVTGNLEIVGTALDNDAIDRVEVIIINESGEEEKFICSGTNFWSYNLTTTNMNDGNHMIKLRAYDNNGLGSQWKNVYGLTKDYTEIPFILDRRSPSITVSSLKSGDIISGNILLEGTASDSNKIRLIEYSIDNRLTFNTIENFTYREKVETAFKYSFSSDVMVDGKQTIWVRATDIAGSQGYFPISVTIDHQPPELEIIFPVDGATESGIFSSFVMARDNVDLTDVKFEIKGIDPALVTIESTESFPFWTFTIDTRRLRSGSYNLEASAFDISGNIITKTIRLNIDQNIDKPVLTLNSFSNNKIVSGVLPVFGTIVDNNGSKETLLTIFNAANQPVYTYTIPSKYNFSAMVDLRDKTIFPDGKYTAELVPVDINDTKGNPVKTIFYIDTQYPVFDMQTIAVWAGKSFGKSIDLPVNINKAGELRSASYSISDISGTEIIRDTQLRFRTTDSLRYTCDNIKIDFVQSRINVNDGIIVIKLNAVDSAGKTSSISVPIVIDKTPPRITAPVIQPRTGMIQNEIVTIEENLLMKEIKLTITPNSAEAETVNTVIEDMEAVFTLKTKTSDNKNIDYNIVIDAIDMAGNPVRSTFRVNFVNSPEPEYTLTFNVVKNDNTVYSPNPILFSGSTFNIDQNSQACFLFLSDNYNSTYGFKINNKTIPFIKTENSNGIYFVNITQENRIAIGSGSFNSSIIDITLNQPTSILTATVNNDYQIPVSKVIWPPANISLNNDFTIYGSVFDDSDTIELQFVDLKNIPATITMSDFEQNYAPNLNQAEKDELFRIYIKDRNNNLNLAQLTSDQLFNSSTLLIKAGILTKTPVALEPSTSIQRYQVPMIDALKRTQNQQLSQFITDNSITVNPNDKIFKIPVSVASLEDGFKRIVLIATDSSGKISYIPYSYIIDKTVPEITADRTVFQFNTASNENTEEEKVTGSVNIKGSAVDTNSISEIVYMFNGQQVVANGKRPYNFIYNLRDLQGINLRSTELINHNIEIFAIDAAGNKTIIQKAITIDPMSDIPQVYINSPSLSGQRFTNVVELGGLATDADGINYVQYRLNKSNGINGEWKRIEVTQGMNWNERIQTNGEMSGKYILEVQAFDIYGTASDIKSTDFHIDLENPTIHVRSPETNQYLKGETVIIGNSSDPNEIQKVQISINNGWSYFDANGSESWNYRFNSATLPDGELRVFIRAKDNAGSESFSFSLFNIDNTAPEIEVLYPRDGSEVGKEINIVGRSRDNIGLKSVEILLVTPTIKRINNQDVEVWVIAPLPGADANGYVSMPIDSLEAWSYKIDTTRWNDADIDKRYNLVARVTDLAGNVSESSINFKINPRADLPVLEIDQPQPNQRLTGDMIEFFGTSRHSAGIESVIVNIAGKEYKAIGTTNWSVSIPAVELPIGDQRITVRALTNPIAGNEQLSAQEFRTFSYDRCGPIVNVTTHLNGRAMEHRPWMEGTAEFFEKDIEFVVKRIIQERKHIEFQNRYRRTPELIPAVEDIEVSKGELIVELNRYRYDNRVVELLLSLDNGSTFETATVFNNIWRVRVQTQNLSDGVHMLQMKARTASGIETIKFFKIYIDRERPEIVIDTPVDSERVFRSVEVRGSSNDNGSVEEVKIALRQFDKDLGKIPQFIQGLYLWSQYDFDFLGGSGMLVSGGLGMSFFDDIVRLEGMFGWRPSRDNMQDLMPGAVTDPTLYPGTGIAKDDPIRNTGYYPYPEEGYNPRFMGFVVGGKLHARILDIPFEFFYGEDAKNFSISVSIGASFLWFSGFGASQREIADIANYNAAVDGKLLAGFMYQIDYFKVERFGILRKFALYFEHALFFVPAEVNAGVVMQFGLGLRNSLF